MDFARACGLSEGALDDLQFAVGEALANAVEHGYRDGTYIGVRCWREGDDIIVEVEDDGTGFEPPESGGERREPHTVRGYGITIMRALVDHVAYQRNGRVVRLQKRMGVKNEDENGNGGSLTG